MTNYSITQSRKGGRTTAAQSRRHDDAVIARLFTDGYADRETSLLVARKVAEVKRELREWNTEESMRIEAHFETLTPEDAEEWCESAAWNYEAMTFARKANWLSPEITDMTRRAMNWAHTMRKVCNVVHLVEQLRKSNCQRAEA